MRARPWLSLAAAAAVAIAGCGGLGGGSPAPRQVTLALDFTPNAVHAGIYAALRDGLDRAHGVKLVVRQPTASTDSLKLLASGRADLSIVDIHDLGLARERGEDIVGVGELVTRPLAAVIARGGITRPRQLEGRRVGITGVPSDTAVLRAVVRGDGGSYARVRTVTIGFSAVPSLIAGRVDAATAFWNAEGVTLRQRGVPTHDFRVDQFGAPAYPELVIVTRRSLLASERLPIRKALAAIEEGARDVAADPAVALQPLVTASGADPALMRAELRAVLPVLSTTLRLDRRALEGWAAFDARFGILKARPDVSKAFVFGLT